MSPGLGTLDRFRRAAAALLKLDAIRAGGVTEARYASESDLRDIVERNFQVAIQAAIDLANEKIALQNWKTPATAREAFEVLAENHALDPDAAKSLESWAGFRNVLVRSYSAVKPERVVQFLNDELGDLRARFLELSRACGMVLPPASTP